MGARRTPGAGAFILIMGCLAMIAPFFAGPLAVSLVGILLIACGILEMLETFRLSYESSRRSAYLSGAMSILVGGLLLNRPKLILGGLALLFAGSFLFDGINKMIAGFRALAAGRTWRWTLSAGVVNLGLSLILVSGRPVSGLRVVEVLIGIRMLAAGWAMLLGREEPAKAPPPVGLHPDPHLHLPPHPEFIRLESILKIQEEGRRSIDAYWCWIFIALFFAIHIGRMSIDWNLVGMIAPFCAVLGDVATALLIAFGLILPTRLAWRKLTRIPEHYGWKIRLAQIDRNQKIDFANKLYQTWLVHRLRFRAA